MVKDITLLMYFLLVMSPLYAEVTAIKVHSEASGNEMLSLFDMRQAPPKALLWKDLKPGEDFLQNADIESKGYYKLIYHQCQYDIWIEPGKEVNITLKDNGEVDFAGEHAELNDFLAELRQKYPSRDKYSEELLKTHKVVLNLERFDDYNRQYHEQLQAVKQSTLSKADKALANGWVQAVFLENVYKPVVENKVFGKTNRAEMETGYADECAKLDLFAEIVYYPEWGDYLQEVLYTRMKTGKLKLKNPDLWISEWGKTIPDANLRDHFIDYLVRRETLMRYFDDKVIERFQAAKALVKDAGIVKDIEACIAKVDFGTLHPDVSEIVVENTAGQQVKLGALKGKYVFIDFWSTACNPCIGEMPFLHELEKKLEGAPIEFVSIAMERRTEGWKDFLKKNQMEKNQFIMRDLDKNPIWQSIGLSGIPRFVLIGTDSKVLIKNAYRPSNPILECQLRELLKENDK